MASILRLPVEILSEIFFLCSKTQDGCRPRLVATVCKRWRNVALSTSNLWSHIHLDQEEINAESLHSLLELQLQRSGQAPLSIVFCEPRDITSTLKLLLAVSHRWQSLDLSIFTDGQQELIQNSTSHFPILKKLRIRSLPVFELGNIFRPLPLLRELTLSWLSCPIPSTLPWAQLTKFTLCGSSAVVALDVLHSAPNITEIWLYDCHSHDGDYRTITSPIRSLKISHCRTGFARDLLGHLTLPELQELILDDFPDSSIILSFFTGSVPPLTHLSLTGVGVSEGELIALLRLTDTVDHLDISWPSDVHTDTLMEALTIHSGNRRPRLLPNLRELSITGGLSCHNDVLLTMLESRPDLRLVELYYAGRTFFFDRAFDGLRKAGMKMTVLLDGPVDPFAEHRGEREIPS
ncbi:F-box domain-containing protein [Mycena sanguinolenta]|uniref:F-box domain-containing protein n=1 Tax=Mycena sanguinolenta TaxID=230812 RepID=A0A8H7DJB8_9AGAR|nr:F-box domain-containing protein [Mycena sanguinolenta]